MQRGTSKSALLRESARRAVGAHLNVQWSDGTVPSLGANIRSRDDAYRQFAGSIPVVNEGVSPSLIFVISDAVKPARSKKAKEQPSQERRDSEAAWIELFQSAGDYSVFIPGRFFNIVRVDATEVTANDNKYLCSEKAPLVILTTKAGEIASTFDGRAKIKRNAIVNGMCGILRKDGTVASMRPFTRLHDLMKGLQRAEVALLQLDEKLDALNDKLTRAENRDLRTARKTKKPVKASRGTQLAEQAIDNFKVVTLFKAELQKHGISNEEYALLQDVGLPDKKMPPKPVKPEPGKPAPRADDSY